MQCLVRHARRDAARIQRIANLSSRQRELVEWKQDAEHVPAVVVVVRRAGARRQHAGGIGAQALEVAVDEASPVGKKARQPFELCAADARIHVGQVELAAGKRDISRSISLVCDAMEAQRLDSYRFSLVVDDERAAFDRRDVLVGVEAERHQIAEGSDRLALPARTEHQRRILDHAQAVPAGERVQRVHVDQRAGVMRRNDRSRRGSDGRLDLHEVDVARHEIAVDEYGSGANLGDHVEHGKKTLRGRDHFGAGADACELQCDLDRRRRRRQGSHRAAAAHCAQPRFEFAYPGAAGDVPRTQYFGDAGDGLLVDLRTGELQRRRHAGIHGYPRATSQTPSTMKPMPIHRVRLTDSPSR